MNRLVLRLGFPFFAALVAAQAQTPAQPTTAASAAAPAQIVGPRQYIFTPAHANAIYAVGDKVSWRISLPEGVTARPGKYTYTFKKNNADTVQSGELDLAAGPATVEIAGTEPSILYLQITPPVDPAAPTPAGGRGGRGGGGGGGNVRGGPFNLAAAAVSPEKLQPTAPRPADFDAFWEEKIKLIKAIAPAPMVTPGDSGIPGIEFASVRLNSVNGAHVYGQLAKPAREGKFPALLQMQYAGVYPLQKQWVTDRAAEGWLALNVMAHDLPYDKDMAYYNSLPAMIRNYTTIYNDNRDRNYFLQMYLGDYQALEYLTSRPDWDGRILAVIGTSMGGQQSFAMAALYPKVSHMMIRVPAGADSNGALHGHGASYPNWDIRNPKVMETALYFDAVNFAPRIKAKSLVGMGLIDRTATPMGVWTAFNLIQGPKEVIPMIDAGHDNEASAAQLAPYEDRARAWRIDLTSGREPQVNTASGAGPK